MPNLLGKKIIDSIKHVVGNGSHNLHEPYFCGNEVDYLKKTIKTNTVSSIGNYVKLFESKIKKFTKCKYTIAVTNCTHALHLSLIACGINRNEEVITPALTFAATANAITYTGAIPHFVDSEIETLGIDPVKLDIYLKKNTFKKNNFFYNKNTGRKISAIIPVHVFGNICKIERLLKIAKKYNLIVIEDAAEALGSFLKKKTCWNFWKNWLLEF